jgi:alkanesulfonate monooxygenase
MTVIRPRFGIRALVARATKSLFSPNETLDAIDRTRRLVLDAEALGYDTALVAQHLFHARDESRDPLETLSSRAGVVVSRRWP